MKNTFLKSWRICSAVALIAIVCAIFFKMNLPSSDERADMSKRDVSINDHVLSAWIADTVALQERGLSGVKQLTDGQAMLFVFPRASTYGFWMKDMLIPIDMAWFDADHKLIYMEKNADPSTYPKVFSPSASALYVLETKAGELSLISAKIGDVMVFSPSSK